MDKATTFGITDTKVYIPHDNIKLKNWNEDLNAQLTVMHQSRFKVNIYIAQFIQVFRERKKHFELSFENEAKKIGHTEYFLLKVEIKNYSAMIDGTNFFD